MTFEFRDPGELVNGDLELLLAEEYPGDTAIGYVPAYRFKMKLAGSDDEVGHIELRIGNTDHIVLYGGNIAYGVRPQHRGRRYAARACRLLMPLARSHGLRELRITCNPDNVASRSTCELAGAELVEIVDLPQNTDMYQEGERQKCRYRLRLEAAAQPAPAADGLVGFVAKQASFLRVVGYSGQARSARPQLKHRSPGGAGRNTRIGGHH